LVLAPHSLALAPPVLALSFLTERRCEKGGRSAFWQRYEDATIYQRRPADPTDPGDAADLSIMGYAVFLEKWM